MAVVDYWWELERRPPPPEDYRRHLLQIASLRPPVRPPLLVVLGPFARFHAGVLAKAAKTGFFSVVDLASAGSEELERDDTAFIKWSPYSEYQISAKERSRIPSGRHIINDTHFDCDKKNVQRAFATVASYSSEVDPVGYEGAAVVKSSRNGRHDGSLIKLPTSAPSEGFVYEQLIDNSIGDNLVYDIRVPFIKDVAPLAYVKFRPRQRRFENINGFAKLVTPADVLSIDEVELCRRFCREIGLEYGEIDVLRDKTTARIYVIDANNTPAGPPRALSPEDRATALRFIALTVCRSVFGLAL